MFERIHMIVDVPALLMLIAANGTPVILSWILGERYSAAIDADRSLWDGRPMFGPHKTWRGIASGTVAAGLVAALLSTGFIMGALFGALAHAGDLISSFLKRRLGRTSGASLPLVDQLPEALVPMFILRDFIGLDARSVIGTAIVFTLLDILTARLRPFPAAPPSRHP